MICAKILRQGFQRESLKKLAAWLSKPGALDYALMKVSLGFNVFLYSDLQENFGFYSDIELLDFLRIGFKIDAPCILLSMNATIYKVIDICFGGDIDMDRGIAFTIGASQIFETETGRNVTFSIPATRSTTRRHRPSAPRPTSDAVCSTAPPRSRLRSRTWPS